MSHINEVASRIYYALDIMPDLQTPQDTLTDNQRRDLYFEVKPLIIALAKGSGISPEHRLLPQTAHYILQSFNGVLRYDPATIIELASDVCKAASILGYQFDSLAISEIVKFVEQSLADHKEVLKDSTTATALGEILDIFVRAGWPQALQLTFKLDQVVR
jgi:hypothetical protein